MPAAKFLMPKVTVWPPKNVPCLSFWIVGFAAAYGLGLHSRLGAIGIWAGLSLGLTLYAILLVWRFHALTRDQYLPAVVTTRAEARA